MGSEYEVSGVVRDFFVSFVFGSCEDSVVYNGVEVIDLSFKLDFDGFVGFDFGGGFGFIGC